MHALEACLQALFFAIGLHYPKSTRDLTQMGLRSSQGSSQVWLILGL